MELWLENHTKYMVDSPKTPVKDILGVSLCIVRTFCVLFVIKLKILMKWHIILLLSSLYVVEFLLFSTAPSARLFVQDGQDPKQGKRGIHQLMTYSIFILMSNTYISTTGQWWHKKSIIKLQYSSQTSQRLECRITCSLQSSIIFSSPGQKSASSSRPRLSGRAHSLK